MRRSWWCSAVSSLVALAAVVGCSGGQQTQDRSRADCGGGGRYIVSGSNGLGDTFLYHEDGRMWDGSGGGCVAIADYWRDLHPRVSPYCVWIAPAAPNRAYTNVDARRLVRPNHVTTQLGDGC